MLGLLEIEERFIFFKSTEVLRVFFFEFHGVIERVYFKGVKDDELEGLIDS